jgi:hypothetical protein
MEIIDIFVEYPSGMTIADRASYLREADQVFPSERLQAFLREFSMTEAPPAVSAIIGAEILRLDSRTDGCFSVGETLPKNQAGRAPVRLFQPFTDPTENQRQQFGRFCHTLAAAAFLGAVGAWHLTQQWTPESITLEISLVLSFVLTFLRGLHSMK